MIQINASTIHSHSTYLIFRHITTVESTQTPKGTNKSKGITVASKKKDLVTIQNRQLHKPDILLEMDVFLISWSNIFFWDSSA
jgi:hypothetical protein